MTTVVLAAGANIQSAINANPTGTIFQLSAGVYRGQQFLAKSGDQFIGDPGGGTIFSGAIVLNQWTASGAYWKYGNLPAPLAGHGDGSALTLAREDLFINNVLYQRVSSLSQVTAGKWYFDAATLSAYISVNPSGQTVEYSATPNMTYDNGATGVVVKNLTIEKYATDAHNGPIHGVKNWQIVDVTSRWNHGAGINIGAGTVVQGGHYVDNGQIGITGYLAHGAQVIGAEIARNNYAGYNPDWDAGGLKIATASNVLISGNNVHDNFGQGIWADIDCAGWTISGNTVTANRGVGIMYEISYGGTVIRDNTVSGSSGSGIYVSNAQGVEVTGNTVTVKAGNTPTSSGAAGSGGIDIINAVRGSGSLGVYESRNNNVHDNVIIHLGDTAQDGIFIYQAISSPNNIWNHNTYYTPNSTGTFWHFGNTNYTWSSLHQSTSFEATGTDKIGLPAGGDPPPPPPPVTTHQLVLVLSENRYQGDAKFVAKVDGNQVGAGTVTALERLGQTQSFTFSGQWAAGAHDIEIDFTNDRYGGSFSKDRNLYVNDVKYDGAGYLDHQIVMASNGAVHFTVGQ